MQRKSHLIPAALLLAAMWQQSALAQTVRVVNAASYSTTSVAPGSIVTIFGAGLTNATAFAPDAAHPPTLLAGATVTIGGVPALMFYASPTQINAVVSGATAAGTQVVVINSPTGITNASAAIDVNAAPGLFSLTGTGSNEGAIIDALTGRVGAFSVSSRTGVTYLTLFLTGANLATPPLVTVGGVPANITFAGLSPCCAGLQQINVTLPTSVVGAGRIPVAVKAGGQLSNVVEIVVLPAKGSGEFDSDDDNQTRSRELSGVASIPGTSLALVTDENDDVVREIDINARKVIHTISLAADSEPSAVAVNAAGTLAVVAERSASKVAILDLITLTVKGEIPVGAGPIGIAIRANLALVVNGDGNSVTVIDLTAGTAVRTIAVGHAPRGIALDAAGRAYVTNQNDGTVSVIDIAAGTVLSTLNLGASRPAGIQIFSAAGFALVTDPATAPDGKVLLVNLATGIITTFHVNVAATGGASDVVVVGTTAYIANQAAGTISVLPLTFAAGVVTGTSTTLQIGPGVRALAIDTKDNLLLALNEGTGRITLVNLTSGQITGQISGVVTPNQDGDSGDDDHSDHDNAVNLPFISSISPGRANRGTTFTLTLVGRNFSGASQVAFASPSTNGKGTDSNNGDGRGKGSGKSKGNNPDAAFTVTAVRVNAGGTQITATVSVAASASPGAREVRLSTPNGDSVTPNGSSGLFVLLP